MGFLKFNEKYYLSELSKFEGKVLDRTSLNKVKQILKVLDDLADEGYTNLNNYLENKFHIITRLHKILLKHNTTPFSMPVTPICEVHYEDKEFEIFELCSSLIKESKSRKYFARNPFLSDINNYCEWIQYEKNVAYIFLFRDALLPFIYFHSRGRDNLYTWLISRDFLTQITGIKDFDDYIRLPIYQALERNITEFSQFNEFCKKRIYEIVSKYSYLKETLKKLLYTISEEKIIVIESGYCGTMPIMLMALDDRVDFRLYTTAPFLYETYCEKIFCQKYENIRLFETLYSQDLLTKYSSFRNGKFYVRIAQEDLIKNKAIGEIYRMTESFA